MKIDDLLPKKSGTYSHPYSGDIVESPQMVNSTDFGFSSETNKTKIVNKILKNPTEVIEDTADYKIIRSGGDNGGIIALIDNQNRLGYFVKYETMKKKLVGVQSVTQVAIWRDTNIVGVVGITKKMFFNYLLHNWSAVISDAMQTEAGKEFWKGRLAEANSRGYKVGLVEFNHQKIDWYDPTTDFASWMVEKESAWGNEHKHQAFRFIISN